MLNHGGAIALPLDLLPKKRIHSEVLEWGMRSLRSEPVDRNRRRQRLPTLESPMSTGLDHYRFAIS
jgi:hypothetical protein